MSKFFLRVQLASYDKEGIERSSRRRTVECDVPSDLRASDIDDDGEVHVKANCLRSLCRSYKVDELQLMGGDIGFLLPVTLYEVPISARLVENLKARFLASR